MTQSIQNNMGAKPTTIPKATPIPNRNCCKCVKNACLGVSRGVTVLPGTCVMRSVLRVQAHPGTPGTRKHRDTPRQPRHPEHAEHPETPQNTPNTPTHQIFLLDKPETFTQFFRAPIARVESEPSRYLQGASSPGSFKGAFQKGGKQVGRECRLWSSGFRV